MSREDRRRWDERYRAAEPGVPSASVRRLAAARPGRVLDLACGTGADALLLAFRGHRVDAVDGSRVGLAALAAAARARGLASRIRCILTDLDQPGLAVRPRYDVVLCLRFLLRSLLPELPGWLAAGGVLMLEAFHDGHLLRQPDFHRDWLLRRGEAAALFPGLDVLEYEEDAARARVVLRRPQ